MAFFQEERPARAPFLNAPAVVIALIGALIAAHALRVLGPAWIADPMVQYGILNPAVYSPAALHKMGFGSVSLALQLLPPIGHLFLHANIMHLAINSVWLLAFGPVVARRFGPVGFLILFLLCGIAGAAAFVLIQWGQDAGAIGASGAISGLMAAAIRMLRMREPWLNAAALPLTPIRSRQVMSFTVIWMALNLATGLIGIGPTGSFQAIAWQDHLGGFLAGLLLAGPFDRLFGTRLLRRSA
jgi:membrane associated rhomboid family serine protease